MNDKMEGLYFIIRKNMEDIKKDLDFLMDERQNQKIVKHLEGFMNI